MHIFRRLLNHLYLPQGKHKQHSEKIWLSGQPGEQLVESVGLRREQGGSNDMDFGAKRSLIAPR